MNRAMSGNDAVSDLLKSLQSDCLVYPHQLDMEEDRVLLVLLNEHELREHSFLDQRIFRPDMEFEWRPWSEFATEAELLAHKAPNYIFHIGHCGSTLLSRLVAAATGTLALREPVPLRVFAIDRVDGDAGVFGNAELRRRLGLFERAWARGDKPVTVKAAMPASFSCTRQPQRTLLSLSPAKMCCRIYRALGRTVFGGSMLSPMTCRRWKA
jgi:hypothetical protein